MMVKCTKIVFPAGHRTPQFTTCYFETDEVVLIEDTSGCASSIAATNVHFKSVMVLMVKDKPDEILSGSI